MVACGGNESVIVTFMVSGDAAEFNAYSTLVTAFNESHDDIQVEITHIPSDSDYRARLVTDFAAGTPPDISLMNYRRVANFAAENQLEPVGPYLDDSEVIQPADFYEIALQAFTWQGQIICLPQNISSLVVYYNRDLFDAAGLPYPPEKWSWTEFVSTAKALTLDTNGDGTIDQYGLGVEAQLFRLAPFVWQNNAPVTDDPTHPARMTLSRPPSLEALQWFTDLHNVHHIVPGREEEAAQDSESRFIAGTTAMYLNSRRPTPTFREITAFEWDVAPLPYSKTPTTILHSDAYCMSAASENKEAGWAFVEFANSVEGQTIIAATGRTVPSLISVAESPAFLDPTQSPSRSQVFLDNAAISRYVPVMTGWVDIENTATEEIERAFYGDITAEEAANFITQRTEEYFLLAKFPDTP